VGQAGAGDPGTGQTKGTPKAAGSVASRPVSLAPILAAIHPEPPGTTLTDLYARGETGPVATFSGGLQCYYGSPRGPCGQLSTYRPICVLRK
jgi:hypothetical protein